MRADATAGDPESAQPPEVEVALTADEARAAWDACLTRFGRLLRVTTAESGPTIRIISAGRATARERHAYEQEA
jgi:uncharacterized DUF497 family protein